MDSGRVGRRLLSVVSGFELVGWGVADGGVEAGGVPPVDPGQGGEFDVQGDPDVHDEDCGVVG